MRRTVLALLAATALAAACQQQTTETPAAEPAPIAAAPPVMPADAPRVKMQNTLALGAEVVEYDRLRESREAIAARLAGQRRRRLLHPAPFGFGRLCASRARAR